MAFTVPAFNLAVDIYTGPWPVGAPRLGVMGNLAYGRRVQQVRVTDVGNTESYGGQATLLLPALTDVRDGSVGQQDYVQIPAGSGRWYVVMLVEDVGKGFLNEYRTATIGKVWQGVNGGLSFPGLFWPTPIP